MHGKCDFCVALTVHRVPISIDGSPKRTLDLCAKHHAKLIQPVVDALSRYGAVPAKVKHGEPVNHRYGWMRQVGPFKCRAAGCNATTLKNATTLAVHLRLIHELTIEQYVKQCGPLVPATPEELNEPVTVECEEKGCETVYSTEFGNRWPQQAMISHMRGRHGLSWRPGRGVIGKIG